MITENDIDNLEATVKNYRNLKSWIAYEEKALARFQASITIAGSSSFNTHRRDDREACKENLYYTLEAHEIIPIIQEKILKYKIQLDNLRVPRLQDVTTKEK
jgi:hypothetical protein